jgi:tetratricopeptide (TPR) repeat protein
MTAAVSKKARFLAGGAAIVAVLLVSALAIIHTPARSIVWERDYEKAVERARAEKKIILADMFTDWCVLCKDMDRETFGDPALIAEMAGRYVWLKLNTETEEDGKKLQEEFAILTYPMLLVLDSNGQEIDRIGGFLGPQPFKLAVENHLQNPESLGKVRERVEKAHESVELRSTLGNKFLDRQNYRKAEAEFRRVIELDPQNHGGKTVDGHYNLALSLASQTKFDEAIAQLAILEKNFPGAEVVADAHFLRGQIYECCGEKDKAVRAFREYLNKYPQHSHVSRAKEMLAAMGASD